jgi:hypothetical protein
VPSRSQWLVVVVVGLAAMVAVLAASPNTVELVPGTPLWSRGVRGAADGSLERPAVLMLAGVERSAVPAVEVHVERLAPRPVALSISIDRAATQRFAVPAEGVLVVPFAPVGRGVRLDIAMPDDPGAARLRRVAVRREGVPALRVALAGLAGAAVGVTLIRWGSAALAGPLGLWTGGVLGLWAAPVLLLWGLPSAGSSLRLLPAGLLLVAAGGLASRRRAGRSFWVGAALVTAAVFGLAVRLYFLPSAGSWDVDYWKAYALRGTEHGVTRVYGDPLPAGSFWPQLQGRQAQWQAEAFGRRFVIDQPPGIAAAWTASWWLVRSLAPALGQDEGLNAAAKLPAVLGDMAAVLLLLAWFRARPLRAAILAALYWALPISWLSSATLGYFDGAYAPLAVLGVMLAGAGRPSATGVALAAAGLVKATSLLIAPAALVALRAARASIGRAALTGVLLVALALVPFAVDGTLGAASVHVYRILFQERLSGGFANGWWLLGHAVSLGTDGRSAGDPVPYVHVSSVPLPVRPLGTLLFLGSLAYVAMLQRRHGGSQAAALAGATLVIAYGQLAIGVHENHPHAFVLALLATGLLTRRLQALAALLLTSYVLNMLCLSGLGRFYNLRYIELEGLVRTVEHLRTWPGFDLTLLLAAVNIGCFALLMAHLDGELAASRDGATD